ncbi:transmembrane protease serine 3 [Conger conger]|uniref:transmembrane protease serine 3 n=1 Tax=Conger conger TaxID=82655 RepID=UPI002A59EDFA|nr:transmembrane protease serine 3 [Conger conger]
MAEPGPDLPLAEKEAEAAADSTPTEEKEAVKEEPDPSRIEVVSVTDEELPAVETPTTINVSPLGSPESLPLEGTDPEKPPLNAESLNPPTDPPAPPPQSPGMPSTKVQPFLNGMETTPIREYDLAEKTLRGRILARRMELLIGACVLVILCLAIGIGVGVGLSCPGKFRCGSSSRCISSSAQCDGVIDCEHGEDELRCVRLSGKSSVLQVLIGGVWRTVCSEDWSPRLGFSACKQLGYSSYVKSSSLPLSSIEEDYQDHLVSINLSQSASQQPVKIHNSSNLSKTQCSSGRVTSLKCVECGSRPQFRTRVVGGNLSREGQFPWQVSLHIQRQHLCGGSIIGQRWIVTAAHCVYGFASPSLWAVYVGLVEQPANGANSLTVEKIIYHGRYRPRGYDYDIALMKLAEPLNFNGYVEPICLPNFGEQFEDGKMCWISGWGATVDGGEATVSLRFARVPLLSTKACNQPSVYPNLISSSMICAGYLEGGVDTCQGDSGGPLACEDSSVWKLVGATSWGEGCAERNKPGVYARITQFLNWIHEQMEVRVCVRVPVSLSTGAMTYDWQLGLILSSPLSSNHTEPCGISVKL